jgi:hypothetical protein
MRTTIDLPEDLHRMAKAVARDQGRTFSETVVVLLRRALGEGMSVETTMDELTGLPTIRVGRIVTSDDARTLEDDE